MTTTSDTPLTDKARLDVLQAGRPARVKASFAEGLERENQLLREELEHQAICNGAGAERELALRAAITALQKELEALRWRIVKEGYIITNFDGTIELAIDPHRKGKKGKQ